MSKKNPRPRVKDLPWDKPIGGLTAAEYRAVVESGVHRGIWTFVLWSFAVGFVLGFLAGALGVVG